MSLLQSWDKGPFALLQALVPIHMQTTSPSHSYLEMDLTKKGSHNETERIWEQAGRDGELQSQTCSQSVVERHPDKRSLSFAFLLVLKSNFIFLELFLPF